MKTYIVLGVVVSLVMVLAACASVNRTPSSYNTSVRTNFLRGCEQQSRKDGFRQPTKLCTCVYAELRNSVPFGDFRKINEQLTERPAPLPPEIVRLIRRCER